MPNSNNIPHWVQSRILAFFNNARSVDDILDGTIQDDPSDGPGNTMGRTLAARILRVRNEIRPFRRFMEFSQLDDIKGVGEGTLKDLVYSFGTSAAAAFRNRMYDDSVIYEANWPLEYFRYEFDDSEAFNELAHDKEAFRSWVAERIAEISTEREVDVEKRDLMVADINNAYIDTYHNTIPAPGYALALWFYEFDADNWFSWERIQEACIFYFDYYSGSHPWDMELRFFKGFTNRGIIQPGISAEDLPVVVNWPEQAITIWFSELYD